MSEEKLELNNKSQSEVIKKPRGRAKKAQEIENKVEDTELTKVEDVMEHYSDSNWISSPVMDYTDCHWEQVDVVTGNYSVIEQEENMVKTKELENKTEDCMLYDKEVKLLSNIEAVRRAGNFFQQEVEVYQSKKTELTKKRSVTEHKKRVDLPNKHLYDTELKSFDKELMSVDGNILNLTTMLDKVVLILMELESRFLEY